MRSRDSDWFIPEYVRLRDSHASGGPAHIVSEDGNVRDSDLDFCEQEAMTEECYDCGGKPCADAIALLKALRPLSPHRRLMACGFGEQYLLVTDPVTGEME